MRFDGGQPVLGLAEEFRLANEDGQHGRADVITSSVVIMAAFLLPISLAIGLQAACQRDAQPGLMGAAFAGVGIVLQ